MFAAYRSFGIPADYNSSPAAGTLPLQVDLLGSPICAGPLPTRAARNRAILAFYDQVRKSRLPSSWIGSADLTITAAPTESEQPVAHIIRRGRDLTFTVTVEVDTGRVFQVSRTVFVASHDPSVERRSGSRAGTFCSS
jgi:hypothetical protein